MQWVNRMTLCEHPILAIGMHLRQWIRTTRKFPHIGKNGQKQLSNLKHFSFELVRNAIDTGWLVLSRDTHKYVAIVRRADRPGRHWQWKPLNEGTVHDWFYGKITKEMKCAKCGLTPQTQAEINSACLGSGYAGDFPTARDAAMAALDELLDGSTYEDESDDGYAEACLIALRGTG